MTRRFTLFILCVMLVLLCGIGYWSWSAFDDERVQEPAVRIGRFDRVLDEYVSLGSYTALHRLNTEYPVETKLLIENVLQIGRVDEADVEKKLRHYYLDSTVQVLLDEVHHQYADLSDLETLFAHAFDSLRALDASFPVPHVYAQIACLRQSIVVADTLIGISLDKYLGQDFPIYPRFFTPEQRRHMTREDIVPDAVELYIKSLNP